MKSANGSRYNCGAMRLLRALIVLLLCTVVPMSGLAATGLAGPCAVQMTQEAGHDEADMGAMSDCDMNSSPDPEKAKSPFCKISVQCQLGSLYFPAPSALLVVSAGPGTPVVFVYAQSMTASNPGWPWRPPRAL